MLEPIIFSFPFIVFQLYKVKRKNEIVPQARAISTKMTWWNAYRPSHQVYRDGYVESECPGGARESVRIWGGGKGVYSELLAATLH